MDTLSKVPNVANEYLCLNSRCSFQPRTLDSTQPQWEGAVGPPIRIPWNDMSFQFINIWKIGCRRHLVGKHTLDATSKTFFVMAKGPIAKP